jgi:prepilin-type N-terminal cleavage/methylation domain-containing protein
MWHMQLSNNGFSMVEVLIAMFLTTIAVLAVMPMMDKAFTTTLRSDYFGRAQGILQSKLEQQELVIMNSSNTVTTGTTTESVTASGASSVSGDMTFTVVTTTSAYASFSNAWLVNVKVTWPGNSKGVSNSLIVTQQTGFSG